MSPQLRPRRLPLRPTPVAARRISVESSLRFHRVRRLPQVRPEEQEAYQASAGVAHHPHLQRPPHQSARLAVGADRRQSQAVSSRRQTRRRQRRRHRLAPSRRRIRCSSSLSRSRMRPGRRCNRLRQAWLRPRWNRSIRLRRRTLVQPRLPKAVHRRLSPRRRPQPAVARPAWGWVRVEAECRHRCH